MTFTLTGFSTVKREGIELDGLVHRHVNADLKVGALAETITVTGETPIVDMQSVRGRRRSAAISSRRSRPPARTPAS